MHAPSPPLYSVAVASPRDTRALRPTVSNAASSVRGVLCVPESDRPVIAPHVWSEPVRRDWIASRLAASRATAAVLARSAERATLSISLAHSEGHAIAAAARHPARVGVDLERDGAIAAREARYFLSRRERRDRGRRTLTELWALKESAWKALGCDDTTAFSSLELILDVAGAVRAVRLHSAVLPAIAEIRRPWLGWTAAVIVLTGVVT